jgi:hypothetical protein
MSVALVSAATATATAFTVGVEPPPAPAKRVSAESVDLAAAIRLLPNHDQVPDITGGLGTAIYNGNQALADTIIRAVVNGLNLTAVAQATGVDPHSLLTGLLADLPANLLPGILASLSLDVPVLGPVLDTLSGGDLDLLTSILNLLHISEVTDGTLTGVLALLGLDLSDPLNLGGLDIPGLNIITAGPTFAALKTLGLDLGWVPSLPNSVANEINGTQYARLGVDGVLDAVLTRLQASHIPGASALIAPLAALIASITDPLTSQLPDVIDVRVTPTVGIGLGAFAAAMAYEKVLADLSLQPGGLNHVFGTDPILGSLTILPLVLINNPARPDGGALARFGPLAALFGINTVNPTTHATSSGDGTGAAIPLLGTGVTLGNANVLPLLVDATYEYQPLSDLASWPNAFTLVNNLAAALSPTYMLRGLNLDLGGLTDQLLAGVSDAVDGIDPTDPNSALAINLYVTLHSKTLPMLEPLYLASDFLNIVGLKPLADVAMHLANALAPALTTLTNIGYANAVQNADGTITRDFSDAGTETPFLSFANIDYGKALGDSVSQLFAGFQKEFFSGNPTPNTPNVLANLLNALLDGSLLNGAAATTPLAALSAPSDPSATGVPSANARLLKVAAVADPAPAADDASKDAVAEKVTTSDDKSSAPTLEDKSPTASEPTTPAADGQTPAADADASDTTDAKPVKGPKHAKPDADSGTAGDESASDAGTKTPPKHAKPTTNETRDTANDFSPKGDKLADKPAKTGDKGSEAESTGTAGSDAGSSDAGSSDKAA